MRWQRGAAGLTTGPTPSQLPFQHASATVLAQRRTLARTGVQRAESREGAAQALPRAVHDSQPWQPTGTSGQWPCQEQLATTAGMKESSTIGRTSTDLR